MKTKYDKVKKNLDKSFKKIDSTLIEMDNISEETNRLSDIAKNSSIYLDNIELDFKEKTQLTKNDMSFLFTAVALQCIRQYIVQPILNDKRLKDADAAKKYSEGKKVNATRSGKLYYPSKEEIANNPVPFDATFNSGNMGFNLGGGSYHRNRTLGHDPLLGWIFGTANIATRTCTMSKSFKSVHVKKGQYGKKKGLSDYFYKNASTTRILHKTFIEDVQEKNFDILSTSILKEGIHLLSDVESKQSIPLPLINSLSPKIGEELTKYGIDILKITQQVTLAQGINLLISMIHYLFRDKKEDLDYDFYKIRTKKIVSYSNIIASTSNIVYVALSTYMGDKESAKLLDVGGFMVTLYQIASSKKLQTKIYKEFLSNEWYKLVIDEI